MSKMTNTIISIKKIDDYPNKDLEKNGLFKINKKEISSVLKKIEDANMKRFHSTLCWDAMYNWIVDRCALKSDADHFYIFKDRYDVMLKQYSTGKIHCPSDLKFDTLNPLVRMFLEGNVCEC
jgi:hypothetical protein